jgi:hypothetical protein
MFDLKNEEEGWLKARPLYWKLLNKKIKSEAQLYGELRPLIGRWLTGHLTETEGYILLDAFSDSQKDTPLPTFLRRRITGLKKIKSKESTTLLAIHFNKDTATVRRWCKKGLVPGAYLTSKRHWRIKYTKDTFAEVRRMLHGRLREPKSLFNTQAWKKIVRNLLPVFTKFIPLLFQLDADLRHLSTDARPRSTPGNESLSKLLAVQCKGGEHGSNYLVLRLIARNLFLQEKPVTAIEISKALGASRRTLFRRYPGRQIKEAIRHATEPLESGEPAKVSDTVEDDRTDVENIFRDILTPARSKATKNTSLNIGELL